MPAAAALTLLAIVTERGREVDEDLHLVAPEEVAPGERLPLRAQLYTQLRRPEGAELITPAVLVELRAAGASARVSLQRSYAHTLDGMLVVPRGLRGQARLIARAQVGNTAVSVERALRIGSDAKALLLRERELPPLRRFDEGPVVSLDPAQPPPNALHARLAGGLCVPEAACELFVHVGAPAAEVAITATPSVSPEPESARPSLRTSGVVHLRFVTHGPEATVTLRVTRDGVAVAARTLRLALGLGVSALVDSPRVFAPRSPVELGLDGPERGCIVDAFRNRRWLRTGALAECRGHEPVPFEALGPGPWRLQLRRDPFSTESAGVRSVYVRAEREHDLDALHTLARAALEQAPGDALAQAVQADAASYVQAFESTAGYLLALLDDGVIQVPAPASGYPAALLQQGVTRARVRTLALFALGLCALLLGLLVALRGLAAVSQAERVMAEAGEEPRQLDRQRLRMTLRVLATVCSLLVAFLAIAAYIVARSQAP